MPKSGRSLDDLAYWTGRELENWTLFISVPILYKILPDNYLKHWALLVQDCHLLLSTKISKEMLDVADQLITDFVKKNTVGTD